MNTYKKIAAVVIVMLVLMLGVSIYQRKTEPAKTITLGILAPLSGQYSVAGENYQKGILLAKDLYEKEHPDKKIKIIIEDDGFDARKGVTAYKKLTSVDHIDALMMVSTPVIDAIHADAVTLGIPVMQLGIQTEGLAKDNIFQMSPAPELPIIKFADYINTNHSFKKVAALYDNTSGGIAFYNAFKSAYKGSHEGLIVNSREDLQATRQKFPETVTMA